MNKNKSISSILKQVTYCILSWKFKVFQGNADLSDQAECVETAFHHAEKVKLEILIKYLKFNLQDMNVTHRASFSSNLS